jgi:glycerate kinase
MKIVIAPDKFKGSLNSVEVCRHLAAGLLRADPTVDITSLPMADGGDGFASILKKYLQTETVQCLSADPLGRPIRAGYEWNQSTKTAIVELAVSSGLVLLSPAERNPLHTSTFGTGLVIEAAIRRGAEYILLGLGGSATNDAGMGILQALGFRFYDEDANLLDPAGRNLTEVARIQPPDPIPLVKFIIACDVTNPLYGRNGAAVVYAPQKGADEGSVEILDRGLKCFNEVLTRQTGVDNAQIPGTGAAGGIAAGLKAFYPVELRQGIEIVAGAAELEAAVEAADCVFTGEGQIDAQSSSGKVISYVARIGKERQRPVVAFAGRISLDAQGLANMNFQDAYAISDRAVSLDESIREAGKLLEIAAFNWLTKRKENV